jgi:hypothetical protein
MQEQQKKGNSVGIAIACFQCWAAMIYPMMRRNWGSNHPGMRAVFGIGWVFLWIAYTHADGLIWIIPLYLLFLLENRMKHARGTLDVHSDYSGEPVMAKVFCRFKNEALAKKIGEPLISLVFGVCLLEMGYEEGKFFTLGALALLANQTLIGFYERRRFTDMRDAQIESEALMREIHNRRRA